jgi:hypothetical protein
MKRSRIAGLLCLLAGLTGCMVGPQPASRRVEWTPPADDPDAPRARPPADPFRDPPPDPRDLGRYFPGLKRGPEYVPDHGVEPPAPAPDAGDTAAARSGPRPIEPGAARAVARRESRPRIRSEEGFADDGRLHDAPAPRPRAAEPEVDRASAAVVENEDRIPRLPEAIAVEIDPRWRRGKAAPREQARPAPARLEPPPGAIRVGGGAATEPAPEPVTEPTPAPSAAPRAEPAHVPPDPFAGLAERTTPAPAPTALPNVEEPSPAPATAPPHAMPTAAPNAPAVESSPMPARPIARPDAPSPTLPAPSSEATGEGTPAGPVVAAPPVVPTVDVPGASIPSPEPAVAEPVVETSIPATSTEPVAPPSAAREFAADPLLVEASASVSAIVEPALPAQPEPVVSDAAVSGAPPAAAHALELESELAERAPVSQVLEPSPSPTTPAAVAVNEPAASPDPQRRDAEPEARGEEASDGSGPLVIRDSESGSPLLVEVTRDEPAATAVADSEPLVVEVQGEPAPAVADEPLLVEVTDPRPSAETMVAREPALALPEPPELAPLIPAETVDAVATAAPRIEPVSSSSSERSSVLAAASAAARDLVERESMSLDRPARREPRTTRVNERATVVSPLRPAEVAARAEALPGPAPAAAPPAPRSPRRTLPAVTLPPMPKWTRPAVTLPPMPKLTLRHPWRDGTSAAAPPPQFPATYYTLRPGPGTLVPPRAEPGTLVGRPEPHVALASVAAEPPVAAPVSAPPRAREEQSAPPPEPTHVLESAHRTLRGPEPAAAPPRPAARAPKWRPRFLDRFAPRSVSAPAAGEAPLGPRPSGAEGSSSRTDPET